MQSTVIGGWALATLALVIASCFFYMMAVQERHRRRVVEGELDRVLDGVMLMNVYQTLAMRTAKAQGNADALSHALLGMGSEVGELMTHWKAHLYYGKALDRAYMLKELGDALWFLQRATGALGFTLDEVARTNIEKLRARYPAHYSNEAALARADEVRT